MDGWRLYYRCNKKKPYLPIIEFKVGTPVLTMAGLKEEINDLRREVNELKKRRQV